MTRREDDHSSSWVPENAPVDAPIGTGHEARSPLSIPGEGWISIARRVGQAVAGGDLWINCGCIGFFGFLSLFPALIFLVLIYGLLFDPTQIQGQLEALRPLMPPGVFDLLSERLGDVAARTSGGLTVGLLISVAVTAWTGTRGVNAVINLLNLSYHEPEARGFFRRLGLAIVATLGALTGLIVVLLTVAALPLVLARLPIEAGTERLTLWARWPILAVFVFVGLMLLYRRGANRRPAKWRWLVPGAALTTLLWIAISLAFSAFVESSEFYGVTFGTLSVAAVLMLWIYYSALAIGIGAILNAEIELQTRRDSTRGAPRPRGRRGAIVADRLPPPDRDGA
jgi:membrane protein